MCSAETRVTALMERLVAAGFAPRREDRGEYIALITEVPKPLPAETWKQLYELLATADGWGLENRGHGLVADASVRKTPATKPVVRGHGRQL